MVHVSRVATDKDVSEKSALAAGIDDLDLGAPGADEFTASVYGSRFAACDIPKHEMPEGEMPKDVVYRLIKSVNVHETFAQYTLY